MRGAARGAEALPGREEADQSPAEVGPRVDERLVLAEPDVADQEEQGARPERRQDPRRYARAGRLVLQREIHVASGCARVEAATSP